MKRCPPVELNCLHCNQPFFRRYSYHRFLIEKRGITDVFCSVECKNLHAVRQLPETIAADYLSGLSTIEIAKKYGVSWSTIRNRLIALNVPLRKKTDHLSTDKNPTKDKGHSKKTKDKLSEMTTARFKSVAARKVQSDATIRQFQEGRTGKVNTVPEQLVAQLLNERNIVFVQQFRISNYLYDFFLPEYNLIIEVHGTFWHADPRFYSSKALTITQVKNVTNDARKELKAKDQGYQFCVLWEYDIETSPATILKALVNL